MKTVGKQLEEGRLEKKWTPEMAARETKIRVDRLLDLESDNFSNFSNPTYARGFVRTYARALNLDEYRLLRQLDQKLPEWDGTLLSESGVVYMTHSPELPPQQPRGNKLGSALLWGLCLVSCGLIAVVLYANYTNTPEKTTSVVDPNPQHLNSAVSPNPTAVPQALPVNPSDLPPGVPVAAVANSTAPSAVPVVAVAPPTGSPGIDINAIPVAPAVQSDPGTAATPVAAPTADPSQNVARAVPVDPSDLAREIAASNSANPTPVASVAPSPSPAPAAKALSLFSHGDCYVTIKQVDSHNKAQLIYQNEIHAGDTVDFDGIKFRVKLSDPAMIDVNVNGALYSHHTDHDEETFEITSRP